MHCFFVSDLHGHAARYDALFRLARAERPDALLLGGDLLPGGFGIADRWAGRFLDAYLGPALADLARDLGPRTPRVFAIPGNDDPRACQPEIDALAARGLLEPLHGLVAELGPWQVAGYACVPPTPFALKDWERYDVSRYVDPGCVSPEEGRRTVPVEESVTRYGTIAADVAALATGLDPARSIFLFHAPPYRTCIDRADLDGRSVDHCPLDVHVGSIAIRRFIETAQPRVTLHGHVHESVRLTCEWRERLGTTWCFGAAHDGPELALVRFDPERPEDATRELIEV